jgi:NAD(P)H-flavin reductase
MFKNLFLKKNFATKIKPLLKEKADDAMTPIKLTFNFKAQIAKNSFILRFLLPDNDKLLGFNICQHVLLESEVPDFGKMKKPFQPISADTDAGFIDFLVKVYPKKETNVEYGMFSNHLSNLEVNRNAK